MTAVTLPIPAQKSTLSHNLALCVSIFTLCGLLLSGAFFIANIDKTNAIHTAQIDSINARLDRIENKLEQVIEMMVRTQ